jgi:hypothetical protein
MKPEAGRQETHSFVDNFSASAISARGEKFYVEKIFRSWSADRRIPLDKEIAKSHERR